jgi:RNA polymerase sigma-70 factor (ECF subfamily)
VSGGDQTIWTLIEEAAGGAAEPRDAFARAYLPLVRRYLGERWRGSPLAEAVEDAAQDVLVECLKDGGVLERAERGRPQGFRAFLFGAARNVARRHEASHAAPARPRSASRMADDPLAREEDLGKLLDREWARALVRQAAEHHRRTALARGAVAREGVELLRLRFEEGLPLREIATRWHVDPAVVHRRFRQAREGFRRSLRKVVAFHQPGTGDVDEECRRLLELLGGD